MKGKLDWQSQRVVNIWDEITLWSAPFGRLLLENIPMGTEWNVVDLGFGTGFPLIELSQRFGNGSTIYGVDIWPAGINKTKEKIEVLTLSNVKLIEQSATSIPLKNNSVDLISSNLGVNNFDEREKVYHECYRILKKDSRICLTTNPVGTFKELFELFEIIFLEFDDSKLIQNLKNSISRRGTKDSIVQELKEVGFTLTKEISDKTNFRFVDPLALLDHSLIRLGFLDSWESMVPKELHSVFFKRLQEEIQKKIDANGEFSISVPMLYLEFKK